MVDIDRLLEANQSYARSYGGPVDQRPAGRAVVVTCMDTRIDPLAVLGLRLGEVHVLRNAGGRVTDDTLRSLALSVLLGVRTVIVMQHTGCALAGVSDDQLRERTGADLDYHTIGDHSAALHDDIARLTAAPYLESVEMIAGLLYDVESGSAGVVARWDRRPGSAP